MTKIGIGLWSLAALIDSSPKYDWKHLYYTVNGPEVMLWETPGSATCILGTGRRKVLGRLRSHSISGEASLLVEVLPAPKPSAPLPPDVIINDRYVFVRGIPLQPQCDQSKGLYWIRDFRFIQGKIPFR